MDQATIDRNKKKVIAAKRRYDSSFAVTQRHKKELDNAIITAYGKGDGPSLREIGRWVGLTFARIDQILKGKGVAKR